MDVTLYKDHSIGIWANIEPNGHVRVSSEDGDSECTASVNQDEKDRLLLILIQEVFGTNRDAVRSFYDFARDKGPKAGSFRWP